MLPGSSCNKLLRQATKMPGNQLSGSVFSKVPGKCGVCPEMNSEY